MRVAGDYLSWRTIRQSCKRLSFEALMKKDVRRSLKLIVCILAGGLSTRMGRDKSSVRLGPRTMLGHVRATARKLGFPVKTIRRDIVPRSGPIGGIYTALQKSGADVVLFLACDMPFVSPRTLRMFIHAASKSDRAVFSCQKGRVEFPFLIGRETGLPLVAQQIARSQFSLQDLARALKARRIQLDSTAKNELVNVNTPVELKRARLRMARPKSTATTGSS